MADTKCTVGDEEFACLVVDTVDKLLDAPSHGQRKEIARRLSAIHRDAVARGIKRGLERCAPNRFRPAVAVDDQRFALGSPQPVYYIDHAATTGQLIALAQAHLSRVTGVLGLISVATDFEQESSPSEVAALFQPMLQDVELLLRAAQRQCSTGTRIDDHVTAAN